MKKIVLLLTAALFTALSGKAQKFQGFEGTANDNWNYSVSPATYVNLASEDYWGITSVVGDNSDSISPATGANQWSIWDLENPATVSPFVHTMEFDPISISGFAINELSFKYYSFGFDGSDSLGYIVAYDNGTTWNYSNYVALDKNTGAWTTVTVNAPANSQYIRVLFYFRQNGGGDWAALDDINLYSANNDVVAPIPSITPADADVNVAINTLPQISFNEDVRLLNNTAINNTNIDAVVDFRLTDSLGSQVAFDATFANNTITITPNQNLANNQVYYFALKENTIEDLSDNAINYTASVKFTTIVPQTQFNAGDLVPVAYRMNASGADDEIAILTLVNILPGTFINFTDAKYTDNAQAQCDGGFTWEAPVSGVAAGTVIEIKNDALTANMGTLTGNGFGLSSGGDQVMVYTGTTANPNHIMALSSNAWLTNNTSCSGSESKLPTGLSDGSSSINLSTAPGNVSGNTVNAYYSGTMNGTVSQLRTSILNPANWNGVGAGTSPQTWPTWAFPGPPSVVSVTTLSNTTIQIIFNSDLDATSAAQLANYTGISGLTQATVTSNGTLADTVVLTYSSSFGSGSSYTLTIDGVQNTAMQSMALAYIFNFTYSTHIEFDDAYLIVEEDAGTVAINFTLTNPSSSTIDLVLKSAPFSTAGTLDINFTSQTITANQASIGINIPVVDDSDQEQDEYFVLALDNANGVQVDGSAYITVYIKDNDRKAPTATKEIELTKVTSFAPVSGGNSTTEIVVFDPATKRLFTTSAIQDRLDIIDFSTPATPSLIKSVDISPYGGITSVAVKNGMVAVASPNADEQLNGSVVFFNTNGVFQAQVTVGALPDMITFTHDGKKVMTANEGQPNDPYTVDPEGSVSIIDVSAGMSSIDQSKVTTLDFTSFNSQEATLIASGVRKTYAPGTLSQDLEPEYIAVSSDSKKAWVTLQENNAMAEIDLQNNTVTSIWALGTKDLSAMGAGFDASDKTGTPLIANWNVKAFFMPDAVACFQLNNVNYLVTANEGDEKEYGPLNERTTVGNSGVVLNPAIYPNAEVLKEDHNLGRLRITNLNGVNGGQYDQLYVVGPRSFAIWNADTKALIYDSGDNIELITSQDPTYKHLFNSDNEENELKGRSRSKGPEPEGVTLAQLGTEMYAFIGLERIGGVMVFNITDPNNPVYVDYNNLRDLNSFGGDNGPEGLTYISPQMSPDGKAYLIVANEISGTLSIFEIGKAPKVVSANFASASASVAETASALNISINLDAPAEESGTVTMKLVNGTGAVYGDDYSTNPVPTADSIVLQFAKGSSSAQVSFIPVNDSKFEQNETVILSLSNASEWLRLGANKTFTVTIVSEDPNGIRSLNSDNPLKAYPNPLDASQTLNLNKSVVWTLYGLDGKAYLNGEGNQINLSTLVKGSYVLRSLEGEFVKVIIQ